MEEKEGEREPKGTPNHSRHVVVASHEREDRQRAPSNSHHDDRLVPGELEVGRVVSTVAVAGLCDLLHLGDAVGPAER